MGGEGDRYRSIVRGVGDVFSDCAECPEMVVIPSGRFRMGCLSTHRNCPDFQLPAHGVTILRPFALGRYEVTFAQWDACAVGGGCGGYSPEPEDGRRGDYPVTHVTWEDAQSYVSWLSAATGFEYRLPSESEWEYAARAGTVTEYWWGDDIGVNRENCYLHDYCGDPWGGNAPVGSFPANPWGLHDMLGNVLEYVQDCWNGSYTGAPSDGSAWEAGDCARRIGRGGTSMSLPGDLRTSNRAAAAFVHRDGVNAGFRVARTLGREAPRRMVDTAAPAAPPQRLAATSDACVPPRTTDAASRSVFEHCLRIGRLGRLARAEGEAVPTIDALEQRGLLERPIPAIRISWPDTVFFDVDDDRLRPDARPKVRMLAEAMARDVGDVHLFVIGHTDDHGGHDYNMDLSDRRARNVLRELRTLGVPELQMSSSGMGELQPVADNHTETGRAANRRVEFMMSEFKEANYALVEAREVDSSYFLRAPLGGEVKVLSVEREVLAVLEISPDPPLPVLELGPRRDGPPNVLQTGQTED